MAGPYTEYPIPVVRDGQRRQSNSHRTDVDIHDGHSRRRGRRSRRSPPASQTIASGATAALSVVATGTAPLTYQWYPGDERDDDDTRRDQQRELHDTGTDSGDQLLGARHQHLRARRTRTTAAITIGVGPAITTQPAASSDDCVRRDGAR